MGRLKGCLTPRIEGGGRENGHGMRCGAQGSAGRRCKADGGGACSIHHGEEEESRVGQKAKQASGAVGPTRPEGERNSFSK
jgi:hypothetical protein